MNRENDEKNRIQISGVIVKRRCLGKHLSFATLSNNLDQQPHDELMKVVFRRARFDESNDSSSPSSSAMDSKNCLRFPVKASDLPYGAHVTLRVVSVVHEEGTTTTAEFEVRSWSLVGEHPRSQARQAATLPQGGAVSCTKYLKARGDLFQIVQRQQQSTNDDQTNNLHLSKRGRAKIVDERNSPKKQNDTTVNDNAEKECRDDHHGSGAGRARIFAEWLVDSLLQKAKDGSTVTTVLDVAGGKGQLSVELAKFGIASTVIDPLIRSKRSLRKLDKSRKRVPSLGMPCFVAAHFERDQATDEIVQNYDCLVGFHPDECTESIVDMALKHDKVFAIVPCCVFPSLSPLRQLGDGKQVQSYDEFLTFLMEKDTRLKRTTLPIEGKNQVIYLGASDE
eukprot:scaffold703_cov168-Amphora_coffeaeformis.AAC.21